ncbi:MAG: hypothetical protein AB7O80_14330 [Acetobacteraceae bacterium]
MRRFMILFPLLLTSACSGGPAALGITGPSPMIAPTTTRSENPGELVDPSINPDATRNRYWGYN